MHSLINGSRGLVTLSSHLRLKSRDLKSFIISGAELIDFIRTVNGVVIETSGEMNDRLAIQPVQIK